MIKRSFLILLALIIVLTSFTSSALASGEKTEERSAKQDNSPVIAGLIVTAYVFVRLMIQQKKMKKAGGSNDKNDKV